MSLITAAIIGLAAGLIGLAHYGYDLIGAYRAGANPSALQLAGILVPVFCLIGAAIVRRKPALGAMLMLGSALFMVLLFGFNIAGLIIMGLAIAGAIIAIMAMGSGLGHEDELFVIDQISTQVGHAFSWSIILLTAAMTYEVVMRYVFSAPTTWAFDASYMLYGLLFMTAGAYTLARNGHVRGDFLYRAWPPRKQAGMDLALYILFFFPGILAFIYAGFGFARMSWIMNEHSSASPSGPPVYHFKALIPITGALMLIQGLAETLRCVMCLRTGEWPRRMHDVEELENVLMQEVNEKGLDAKVEEFRVKGGQI